MFKNLTDLTPEEELSSLSGFYESGARAKAYALKELRSRQYHRSFSRVLEEDIENTYKSWRELTLSVLQGSKIPGHIRSDFLDVPDSITRWMKLGYDEIDQVAEIYDLALGKLRSIIDHYAQHISTKRPGASTNYHTTVNGNVGGHAIVGSGLSIEVTTTASIDGETRQLLEQLKTALQKQDETSVKKILGYIADKGVDIVLALATGQLFAMK
jgi:hypothetical protein